MPASAHRDQVRARFRAFPRAPTPNDDETIVKSNLTIDEVRIAQNTLAYHIAHHPGSNVFGNKQAGQVKLVEVYVRPRHGQGDFRSMSTDDLEAVTISELTVDQDMLNVHGTLAGACATVVIDFMTFAPILVLSSITGVDGVGLSSAMNLVWHGPALRGMTLRFVGTTLSLKSRTASARCEVYDKKTGALLISATHLIAPVQAVQAVQSMALGSGSGSGRKDSDAISRAKL